MPVLYCISYSCKVREQISDEKLLTMFDARKQGEHAIEMIQDDPVLEMEKVASEKEYSKWKFLYCKLEPTGPTLIDTNVGHFLKIAKPLKKLEQHCTDCPMNNENDFFGCCGTLSIPARKEVEEWLMWHLPNDIHSPQGKLLQDIIANGPVTGKRVETIRSKRREYINRVFYEDAGVFESDFPATKNWRGNTSEVKFYSEPWTLSLAGQYIPPEVQINSNQIWEMLVCRGNYDNAYAKNIAHIFGYLDNEMNLTQDKDRVPQENDADNIWGIKRFLYLAAQAAKDNLGIVIVEPAIPKEI